MRLIEPRPSWRRWRVRLRAEPLLAVDTEAASFHRYLDRVYLLQISSREETAVVDPLATGGLGPDRRAARRPGDRDRLPRRRLRPAAARTASTASRRQHLFDTRIAAQLLNEPGIGLAALLEKYLGVRLDKRFQRADWSARPLSPEMLAYAAADTHYLPQLRDILAAAAEDGAGSAGRRRSSHCWRTSVRRPRTRPSRAGSGSRGRRRCGGGSSRSCASCGSGGTARRGGPTGRRSESSTTSRCWRWRRTRPRRSPR